MNVDGKISVVTGAASGLGLATVHELVRNGAKVVAVDLPGDPLSALEGLTSIFPIPVDVTHADAAKALFSDIHRKIGVPRILVNCAGILGPARIFSIDRQTGNALPRSMDGIRKIIAVNLVGTFNMIRLFASGLSGPRSEEDLDNGVIVNTSSIAAWDGLSGQTAYSASKAGIASMTLPLARELARYGIRVVALAPGTFDTGMYKVLPEQTRATLISEMPFPKRPGRSAEFAHMVVALVENGMMNGEVIRIDGAVRMREPGRT